MTRNMLKHWAQHKVRLEHEDANNISRIHITLRPPRPGEEYVFVVWASVIMKDNSVRQFKYPVLDVHGFEELIGQAETAEYFEKTIDPQCL